MSEVEVDISMGFPDEETAYINYSGFMAGIEVMQLIAHKPKALIEAFPEYFNAARNIAEAENLSDQEYKEMMNTALLGLLGIIQRALFIMASETAMKINQRLPEAEGLIDPFTTLPDSYKDNMNTEDVLAQVANIMKKGYANDN